LIQKEGVMISPVSFVGRPTYLRVKRALDALRQGRGVLVTDDHDRENEADLIFAAQSLTLPQMAMLIHQCSGVVCLCLTPEKVEQLALPPMVPNNSSRYQTAFTVSIDAAQGVTTGISAADRLRTVQAAIAADARPDDLARPGHVFPLRARPGGVVERPGHTEATVDLMRLAGLKPAGVLCELMNAEGAVLRGSAVEAFANARDLPLVSVADLIEYRSVCDTGNAESMPPRRPGE
jgi:3,4-dihydroxy 2-butanone 4-phosphate synthase